MAADSGPQRMRRRDARKTREDRHRVKSESVCREPGSDARDASGRKAAAVSGAMALKRIIVWVSVKARNPLVIPAACRWSRDCGESCWIAKPTRDGFEPG
jgi:hypothetical protein